MAAITIAIADLRRQPACNQLIVNIFSSELKSMSFWKSVCLITCKFQAFFEWFCKIYSLHNMRFPGELSPNMKKSNFQHLFLLEGKTTDIFRFNVQISFIYHTHGSLEPFLNFFWNQNFSTLRWKQWWLLTIFFQSSKLFSQRKKTILLQFIKQRFWSLLQITWVNIFCLSTWSLMMNSVMIANMKNLWFSYSHIFCSKMVFEVIAISVIMWPKLLEPPCLPKSTKTHKHLLALMNIVGVESIGHCVSGDPHEIARII